MDRKIEVLQNHWYGHGTGSMAKPEFTIRSARADQEKPESDGRYYLRNGEAAQPTVIATMRESECRVNTECLDENCDVLVYEPEADASDEERANYDWCKSLEAAHAAH